MKLNLGCGEDIRLNYINIDLEPKSKDVIRGDFKNLTALGGMIADNSVDELQAINIIQYIRPTELESTLKIWHDKLKSGGQIYIESVDSAQLGIAMSYGQVNIDMVNQLLYPNEKIPVVAIYNLTELESFIKTRFGWKTIIKNYKAPLFYLQMEKA